MRRWFLSFNSPDRALAEGLEAAIERKDAGSRVFFAAKGLRGGGLLAAGARQGDRRSRRLRAAGRGEGHRALAGAEFSEASTARQGSRLSDRARAARGQPRPACRSCASSIGSSRADPTSEKDFGRLMDAAAAAERSRATLAPHLALSRPVPPWTEGIAISSSGESARDRGGAQALAASPDRLPVLVGNSGVGKSSIAQAGIIAASSARPGPRPAELRHWPQPFRESRRWCFLKIRPGTEPLKSLVEAFHRHLALRRDRAGARGSSRMAGSSCCATARQPCAIFSTRPSAATWSWRSRSRGLLPLCGSGRGALCAGRGAAAPTLLRDPGAGAR